MKKVLGVISIILGILFTPIVAVVLFQFGGKILKLMKHVSVEGFEDLAGGLIFLAIIVFLTVTFYRWGYKCLKGKKVQLLDEIIDTKSPDDK